MRADCHMHMILDGYEWRSAIARHNPEPDEKWIRGILKTYQELGFTYLRDGGDSVVLRDFGHGGQFRQRGESRHNDSHVICANIYKGEVVLDDIWSSSIVFGTAIRRDRRISRGGAVAHDEY